MAREAISILADVSDGQFEVVDGQVTNLRGSIGARPTELDGLNLPGLNLWTNVSKLSDEVADAQESVQSQQKPSKYETMMRSLLDSTQTAMKKQGVILSCPDECHQSRV
jgi:hypothetical protein